MRRSLWTGLLAALALSACGEGALSGPAETPFEIEPAFDDVSNNLDANIDATAEVISLTAGGPNGTTGLYIQPRNDDGKNGCNLTGGTTLVVSVMSDNTSAATVSPSSVTFTSCGTTPTLTITPVAVGSATISLAQISNNTGATFNLTPATFTVNVNPPANTQPSVSVAGVTAGASYEGNVPTATCSVTDTEDGNSSFPATLSALSGPLAAFGIGSQTASCSYTDAGGLTATASVTYNIVDTTAPVIAFVSRTPPANGNGWNNADVAVTWSCSDSGSGVVDATVTEVVSAEGSNQSVTGTCEDNAGLSSSDTQSGINIDKTAPTVALDDAANSCTTPGNAGWCRGTQTAGFAASDATSGLANAAQTSFTQSTSTEGSAVIVPSGTVCDRADNCHPGINAGPFMIDATAPTLAGSASPAANGNEWNNGNVTVSFSCSDGTSGIASCTVPTTLTDEGAGQSVSGTATDNAGNSAGASVSGINIDKTAPTASATASPAPNGAGWNNTNVTVSFKGTDGLSGIDVCSAAVVLSGEGDGQSASGTCTDEAGNESTEAIVTGIKIDKTAPLVSVSGVSHGATYTLGSVPVAGCSTSDALSGVKTNASLGASGGPVGAITVTCSGAEDNADNTASSVSATYNVIYAWNGFFQPVENLPAWNSAKAGQSIPVKFSLGGDQGLNIMAAGHPKVVTITCPNTSVTTDEIEQYTTTANNGLVYDPVAGQYNYVWKTDKTWAGKCFRLDVKLNDGTMHSANFKFTK